MNEVWKRKEGVEGTTRGEQGFERSLRCDVARITGGIKCTEWAVRDGKFLKGHKSFEGHERDVMNKSMTGLTFIVMLINLATN